MMGNSLKKFRIEYGNKSDLGRVRSENQDYFGKFPEQTEDLNWPRGQLFIVADGMGGHERGREASHTAVRVISENYYNNRYDDIGQGLKHALQAANEEIYRIASSGDALVKMGTTCTALVLHQNEAFVGHVGDSRLYQVDGEHIKQLTEDHTQVAEMYRKGIISEEEAKVHPSKSVLVRALGVRPDIEIDIINGIRLEPDRYFVMCTDGLAKVSKEEIKEIVLHHSPQEACEILVAKANALGGEDNVTLQIIKIGQTTVAPVEQKTGIPLKPKRKWFGKSLIGLLIAFVLASGFYFRHTLLNWIGLEDSSQPMQEVKPSEQITPVSPPNEAENAEMRDRLDEAMKLFQNGKTDQALGIYQSILQKDPMNLASINGINQIAAEYKNRGIQHQNRKEYRLAIGFYEKALKLLPRDQDVKNSLRECESALQNLPSVLDSSVTTEDEKVGNLSISSGRMSAEKEKSNPGATIYEPQSSSGWEFIRLSADDYEFRNGHITFLTSNRKKMAVFKRKLEDVDVEVTVDLREAGSKGRAGIIVGYLPGTGSSAGYFQFSIRNEKDFLLERISGKSSKELLSIPYKPEDPEKKLPFQMKVKCLGPWIMMYNNQKMLKAWFNEEFVRGNAGLFADPGVYAVFSGFKISPAMMGNGEKTGKEQVQE
jgi:serine/threonine protein phosphatase PrpC